MKKYILFIILNFFYLICLSQHSENEMVSLYKKAMEAYNEKNHAVYLENYKLLCGIRKDYPALTYNLAGAYALNNKLPEAIEKLDELAKKGLFFTPENDSDFILLKDIGKFKKIIGSFKSNLEPKGGGKKAFELEEKDLLSEGLAYDEITKTFFVSSVHKRKIISVDKEGTARDFSKPSDGLWGAFGMKVDAKRRILWVSTSAIPQAKDLDKKEYGKTGVFKYDLNTGNIVKKYIVSDTLSQHMFGDLAVNKDGSVYVTDSRSPNIYKITEESKEPELFCTSNEFLSLQGIGFSDDGSYMFLTDYIGGIFRIEMKSMKIINIPPPENFTFFGIDGMDYNNGFLIGLQNGITPNRIIKIKLNENLSAVSEANVLDVNNPEFNEPTLGTIVNDNFFYIAKSQWGLFERDGTIIDESKLEKPLVMKVKIK